MTAFRSGLLTYAVILAQSFLASGSPVLLERQAPSPIYACGTPGCPDGSCGVELVPSSGSTDTCTIFDSSFVFPPSYQQATGQWNAFWNIPADVIAGNCKVIIRSPAQVDEPLCGVASLVISTTTCVLDSLGATFVVQYCCGDDCASLGPSALPDIGTTALSSIRESFNGQPFLINLEPRKTTAQIKSRDDGPPDSCTGYQVGRGPYTETPPGSSVLAADSVSCPGSTTSCAVSVSFTEEFSWSLSVTIGPTELALFSETLTLENSESQTYQTTATIPPGSSGQLVFSPLYTCQDVFFEDCSNAGDSEWVTGCTPVMDDNGATMGGYSVVQHIGS